jgi:DNA-binding response OmpR family regulator
LLLQRKHLHLLKLRRTLEVLGFNAAKVLSYEDALSCLRLFDYDAILLECSVFGRNVTAVCRELRSLYPRLPILVVGVDTSLDHMVALLDAGADDYTILPLAERLLAARLRSAIRRFRTPAIGVAERFVAGEIVLDPAQTSCREIESPGFVVPHGISRARSVNAPTRYSNLAFCTHCHTLGAGIKIHAKTPPGPYSRLAQEA